MSKTRRFAWALAAFLAVGSAMGLDEKPAAARPGARDSAAPGWIERSIDRIERAIARLEAKLAGRGGSGMGGCEDMMAGGMMDGGGMMGGGMMGGSRPNERWRSPREAR